MVGNLNGGSLVLECDVYEMVCEWVPAPEPVFAGVLKDALVWLVAGNGTSMCLIHGIAPPLACTRAPTLSKTCSVHCELHDLGNNDNNNATDNDDNNINTQFMFQFHLELWEFRYDM